jgi:hypothetical protein
MKIQDLIDYLQRNYEPDDAIVVAWWDQEHFDAAVNLSPDEWAQAAEFMGEMDWSVTHETLVCALDEYLQATEEAA